MPRARASSSSIQRPVLPGDKYDWPRIKEMYMTYKYFNYIDAAKQEGINVQYVREEASRHEKSWFEERSEIARYTQTIIREQMKAVLSKKAVERMLKNLEVSDKLREKALKDMLEPVVIKNTDGTEKTYEIPFNHDQSIRALAEASKIDKDIVFDSLDPKKGEEQSAGPTVNLTAIEKLTIILQGAGPNVKDALAKALNTAVPKKLIEQ